MAEAVYDIELFCDGPGCQTATRHMVWAESEQLAFGKARARLVRDCGWVRLRRVADGVLVDLCPACKITLVTHAGANPPKEQTNA